MFTILLLDQSHIKLLVNYKPYYCTIVIIIFIIITPIVNKVECAKKLSILPFLAKVNSYFFNRTKWTKSSPDVILCCLV